MVDLCKAVPARTQRITQGHFEIPSFDEDEPGVFTTANTKAATSWTSVSFSWKSPKGDLILIIETPFTQNQKPFHVQVPFVKEITNFHFFQLIDGEEVEAKKMDTELGKRIIMDSDSNYQVIMKVSNTSTTQPDSIYVIYHVGEFNKTNTE